MQEMHAAMDRRGKLFLGGKFPLGLCPRARGAVETASGGFMTGATKIFFILFFEAGG